MNKDVYSIEAFCDFISIKLSETTVVGYRDSIINFLDFCKCAPVEITKYNIIDYIICLKKKNRSVSHIRTRFAGIKRYYKYLVYMEVYSGNKFHDIFENIELPSIIFQPQKVYRYNDAIKIIEVFKRNAKDFTTFRDLVFLLIAATTGARRREISLLTIFDIDFDNSRITFYNTKNKRPRVLFLSKNIVIIIKTYLELRKDICSESSNLFISACGKPMSTANIVNSLNRRAMIYKLKRISFHAFRRGFASDLSSNGMAIEKISRVLGHASINTTVTYYIYLSDLELEAAVLSHPLFKEEYIFMQQYFNNTIMRSNMQSLRLEYNY